MSMVDPLFKNAIQVTSKVVSGETLKITLNHPVNPKWVGAFKSISSKRTHESMRDCTPDLFTFSGNEATIKVIPDIDYINKVMQYFESWLPLAFDIYKEVVQEEIDEETRLEEERERKRLAEAELNAKLNKKL